MNMNIKSSAIIKIIVAKLALSAVLLLFATNTSAQKFVFVDTEYILKNIPAYEAANDQLNQLSKKYETEIKEKMDEISQLQENYRTESVFLTADMKTKKEKEILEKDILAKKLQQTYFGQNGEFFKQREILVKPIQDQVYNAISAIAAEKSYSAVFDKSSNMGLMYNDANLDISDSVLKRLGYSKK